MKIVFFDDNSIGTDIDLSGFESLGEVVRYGSSKPEEVPERVKDADVVIINKMEINERTIGTAEKLKLVCVTATGTNNLDKEFLAKEYCVEKCGRLFYRVCGAAYVCVTVLFVGENALL